MKLIKAIVALMLGVVLGYWGGMSFSKTDHEADLRSELPSAHVTATCSDASPDSPMCETPGEISRADYLRIESTARGKNLQPAEVPRVSKHAAAGD